MILPSVNFCPFFTKKKLPFTSLFASFFYLLVLHLFKILTSFCLECRLASPCVNFDYWTSTSDNLISSIYSMLVFSANLFRLFVCHMCRGEHQFRKIMCKQLDYPNVSCDVSYQYDTTRHMRLVNDTTLHNTKRHKKLELMKNLKKIIKK